MTGIVPQLFYPEMAILQGIERSTVVHEGDATDEVWQFQALDLQTKRLDWSVTAGNRNAVDFVAGRIATLVHGEPFLPLYQMSEETRLNIIRVHCTVV